MRFLVLINPSSHGGGAARRWRSLTSLMPDAEFVQLNSIEEAAALARTASGFETVVACGGDGTINAVADGVMSNPDTSLKFGVIYMGTSPDFCRFHGIPTETEKAVSLLYSSNVREIPVLQANGHCFFCSCNLGIGADVASIANRIRPFFGDKLGTLFALLRCIIAAPKMSLTINGEQINGCNHLLFTRMPYIASGLKIHIPELKDDEYALWFVRNLSLFGWLKMLPQIYSGKPCGDLRIFHGNASISSDSSVNVEFDGDPHGELPLNITIATRKLRLIAQPKEGV